MHKIPTVRLFPSIAVIACCTLSGAASAADSSFYAVHNLVSNGVDPNPQVTVDPNLKNGWGIAFSFAGAGSPAWVADNGTGKSTVYNGDGTIVPLVVTIPAPGSTS